MKVLVTQRVHQNRHGAKGDLLESDYTVFLSENGIASIPISNFLGASLIDTVNSFPQIDGLILTGGNDVNPKLYGEVVSSQNLDLTPERDETEYLLLTEAVRRRWPVLAICRGMQLMNVFFGGKIVRDIKNATGVDHVPAQDHQVILVEQRARALWNEETLTVNSYHNHALVDSGLAKPLEAFCIEPQSKIIEGYVHEEFPMVGVQFHPERGGANPDMFKLIKSFREQTYFWSKK